jgi:hypothetical protein
METIVIIIIVLWLSKASCRHALVPSLTPNLKGLTKGKCRALSTEGLRYNPMEPTPHKACLQGCPEGEGQDMWHKMKGHQQ